MHVNGYFYVSDLTQGFEVTKRWKKIDEELFRALYTHFQAGYHDGGQYKSDYLGEPYSQCFHRPLPWDYRKTTQEQRKAFDDKIIERLEADWILKETSESLAPFEKFYFTWFNETYEEMRQKQSWKFVGCRSNKFLKSEDEVGVHTPRYKDGKCIEKIDIWKPENWMRIRTNGWSVNEKITREQWKDLCSVNLFTIGMG